MLRAYIHGKLRRDGADDEVRCLEDTAAAILFERLFYLPDDRVISILFDPLLWPGCEAEALPTVVEDVAFWPSWAWGGDDSRTRIEPDLVVTFDTCVLVIEAKRFDRVSMQIPQQLAGEWCEAHRQYPHKPIWLLAVSGLIDDRRATVERCRAMVRDELPKVPTHGCGETLRLGYAPWYRLVAMMEEKMGDAPHRRRLLAGVRDGLASHGITVAEPVWLNDLTGGPLAALWPLTAAPSVFAPLPAPPLHSLAGFGPIASSSAAFPLEFS